MRGDDDGNDDDDDDDNFGRLPARPASSGAGFKSPGSRVGLGTARPSTGGASRLAPNFPVQIAGVYPGMPGTGDPGIRENAKGHSFSGEVWCAILSDLGHRIYVSVLCMFSFCVCVCRGHVRALCNFVGERVVWAREHTSHLRPVVGRSGLQTPR